MENVHKNQPKSLEYHTFFFSKLLNLCLLTKIFAPYITKQIIFRRNIFFIEKKSKTKVDIFSILGRIWSRIRIRINIKMKWNRNTDLEGGVMPLRPAFMLADIQL